MSRPITLISVYRRMLLVLYKANIPVSVVRVSFLAVCSIKSTIENIGSAASCAVKGTGMYKIVLDISRAAIVSVIDLARATQLSVYNYVTL